MEQVAPIQLAIRLLIPAGSRLLELPEVKVPGYVGVRQLTPLKYQLTWLQFEAVPDGPGHVVFDLRVEDDRGVPVEWARP